MKHLNILIFLKKVTIPKSVNKIQNEVFIGCRNLTEVILEGEKEAVCVILLSNIVQNLHM